MSRGQGPPPGKGKDKDMKGQGKGPGGKGPPGKDPKRPKPVVPDPIEPPTPEPEPPHEPTPEPPFDPEPPEDKEPPPPAAIIPAPPEAVEIVAGESEGAIAFKLTWEPPEDEENVLHYMVQILGGGKYLGHIETTEREMVLEPDPVPVGERSPTYQAMISSVGEGGEQSPPVYSKRFEVDMEIREVKILPEGPHNIKVGETKQLEARAFAKGGRVTY